MIDLMMSEMSKKHAPPTFRWPCKIFLGSLGVGTPQKKWLRYDWVGGSLREKIIHFILAPSETYLLARFDPLAVTILETLAVITSAGYAPRANLVNLQRKNQGNPGSGQLLAISALFVFDRLLSNKS